MSAAVSLADQLIELEAPLVFCDQSGQWKSTPVIGDPRTVGQGDVLLEKLRDFAEIGRWYHVQLATELNGSRMSSRSEAAESL